MSDHDRATRRRYLQLTGTAATAGALAGLGGAADRVAAQQSGPTVTASDSRITLSNGRIAATIERSDLTSGGKELICSRVGTEPGEDLLGPVGSVYKSPISTTESPRADFGELLGFGVAERTADTVAYQTVVRYQVFEDSRDDPHPVEISYRVTLQGTDPFVLIDHRIQNVGQGSITIDQDRGDIHDGMQAHSHLQIRNPTSRGEYGYVLSNGRGSMFGNVRRWNPQGAAQWGTIYDADTALTVGYIDGSTSPKMWITTGNPTDGLDFLVGEVTLDPDQTVTYRTMLSLDVRSGDPRQQGGDTVSSATRRSDSTDQQFADPDALSSGTGGTPTSTRTVQTTVGRPGLETQAGSSGGDEPDDSDTDGGGIPVLNRFGDTGSSVGLGLAGLLAAVGGYAAYDRLSEDDESVASSDLTGDTGTAVPPGDVDDSEGAGSVDAESVEGDEETRPHDSADSEADEGTRSDEGEES